MDEELKEHKRCRRCCCLVHISQYQFYHATEQRMDICPPCQRGDKLTPEMRRLRKIYLPAFRALNHSKKKSLVRKKGSLVC